MIDPWDIDEDLKGGSYKLYHCFGAPFTDKNHACCLSTYLLELIKFDPVDEPDNRYDQICHPISKSSYKGAGLKEIKPRKVFHMGVLYAGIQESLCWPNAQNWTMR